MFHFFSKQIWGDSAVLSLAQSLGIETSLKSLASITDPAKVRQPTFACFIFKTVIRKLK